MLTREPPVLYRAAEAQLKSRFTTEGTEITERAFFSVISILLRVRFFPARNEKQILRCAQVDMSF